MHCHDTFGQALTNVLLSLRYGVATVVGAELGACTFWLSWEDRWQEGEGGISPLGEAFAYVQIHCI